MTERANSDKKRVEMPGVDCCPSQCQDLPNGSDELDKALQALVKVSESTKKLPN